MGDLFGLGKHVLTGESVFLTHFTNESKQKSHVAFAAPFPGSVIFLNLAQLEEEIICQKDSFLAAALGTQVDIAFHKNWVLAFLVGKASYSSVYEVTAWIYTYGWHRHQETLNNETLRMDTGCLVGFCGDIDYSIEMNDGLESMFFGGEGLFLATLSGSGSVWIQSMPFSRLAERVMSYSFSSTQGEE